MTVVSLILYLEILKGMSKLKKKIDYEARPRTRCLTERSLHAPSAASYLENFHFFRSGKPQSVQEVSVLTLYSYLAYRPCFLKMSAIKIPSERGFSSWCQAVTGQAVLTGSRPRASAHLLLRAAMSYTSGQQTASTTAGSATQVSCCNAQPWGKDFSLKLKLLCERTLGGEGC